MRRLAVILASAAAALGAAAPAAHAGRVDDASKPVVFLSGGEQAPVDCQGLWGKLQARLRKLDLESADGTKLQFTGGFKTVTNYDTDTHCDAVLTGGANKGIEGQAKDFANWLSATYTSKNKTVDVVAHGTGGLVLRYALAQSAAGAAGWPILAVEDAITLGTPSGGSKTMTCSRQVCQEVNPDAVPGKAMIAKLASAPFRNPQGQGGTDWTAIAAVKDELVTPESALAADAAHETTFQDTKLTHTSMLADDSKERDATVTYQHTGTDVVEWRKAPHVADRVGLNLVYGADGNLSAPTGSANGCTGSNDATGGPAIVRFPGLVDWNPGTADMSYIKSGILEAYADCFKADGKAFSTTGKVRLNGLTITPAPSEEVTIDPATRRVTSDRMTMTIPSKWFGGIAVPIMRDTKLDWYLPKEAGALDGEESDGFKVSGGGKIAGFKLKGSLKLSLGQGTTNLEGTLALPGFIQGKVPAGGQPECGNGVDDDGDHKTDTADDNCDSASDNYEDAADNPGIAVSLRSDNVTGLQIDKLAGTIEGNVKFGKFALPSATLSYSAPDNTWAGSLSAVIPWFSQPKITIAAEVKDRVLTKASVEGDGLAIPLSGPLLLQRLKIGINRDPTFELTIGAAISVGPRIPRDPKPRFAGVEFDGEGTGGGGAFKFVGKLKILGEDWGQLTLDHKGTTTTLTGELSRNEELPKNDHLKIKTSLKAKITGVLDDNGVDISGSGSACFEGSLKLSFYEREQENTCLVDSSLRLSNKKGQVSFTVCGQVDLGVWDGILGWGVQSQPNNKPPKVGVLAGSCDVDAWHTAPASAAQAGGDPVVRVGSGLPAAVIGVEGEGAPPHVALDGPGGKSIPAPASASGIVRGKGYMLIHSTADNTTYVIVGKPAVGEWKVQPQPGSAPIAQVQSADALPAPSVTARVERVRGGKQRLRYTVKRIPGQVVRFREVAGDVAKALGTARGARGSITFTPAFGKGGTRKIVALVEQRGNPRTQLDVARFTAPAPRTLAAPKRVTLRRKGERLTVTWKPVTGAVRYVTEVATGDGRSLMFETKARRVVVKRMFGDAKSTVKVRAVRTDEKLGRARTVRGGR
jgi:hypothetical protein